MFLKNTSKVNIKLNSHDGYIFTLLPGVSVIEDSAGAALLKVYKIESPGGKDKNGFDNGHGLPPILEATKKEWEKGSKQLAQVERFKINHSLIPRASLLKVALKRGIPSERLAEYQIDGTIDPETIANEINALPIPDEVKYPIDITEETGN